MQHIVMLWCHCVMFAVHEHDVQRGPAQPHATVIIHLDRRRSDQTPSPRLHRHGRRSPHADGHPRRNQERRRPTRRQHQRTAIESPPGQRELHGVRHVPVAVNKRSPIRGATWWRAEVLRRGSPRDDVGRDELQRPLPSRAASPPTPAAVRWDSEPGWSPGSGPLADPGEPGGEAHSPHAQHPGGSRRRRVAAGPTTVRRRVPTVLWPGGAQRGHMTN